MSDRQAFIEQYRTRMVAQGVEGIARPNRRRMIVLTLAFTPMSAVAALPVTATAAMIANLIAGATALWLGVVVLVVAGLALGYGTARWSADYEAQPAERGWRRWLPLAVTVVILAVCLAEIVSGSHLPINPVIVLFVSSLVWMYAFLPLATGEWGLARRTLWAAGPAVTFVTIVFVLTQGFFWWRFGHAISDLDAFAQQVARGDRVPPGTHAGGFVLHHVTDGPIRGNRGCDAAFWITGWHENDTRYVAHCVGRPRGGFTHLEGDWWQLKDKQPPSDL